MVVAGELTVDQSGKGRMLAVRYKHMLMHYSKNNYMCKKAGHVLTSKLFTLIKFGQSKLSI